MKRFDKVVTEVPCEVVTDFGVVTVLDGVAAGGEWLLLQFHTGDLLGRKLWMVVDAGTATYLVNASDDGFLFNYPEGTDEDKWDVCPGGEYLPVMNGLEVRLV